LHQCFQRDSKIDIDSVDLLKFPGFQKVPWANITIRPGDCLFIPKGKKTCSTFWCWLCFWTFRLKSCNIFCVSGMFHQVISDGPINLAQAILFARMDEVESFNSTACDISKGEYLFKVWYEQHVGTFRQIFRWWTLKRAVIPQGNPRRNQRNLADGNKT